NVQLETTSQKLTLQGALPCPPTTLLSNSAHSTASTKLGNCARPDSSSSAKLYTGLSCGTLTLILTFRITSPSRSLRTTFGSGSPILHSPPRPTATRPSAAPCSSCQNASPPSACCHPERSAAESKDL